MLCHAKTHTHTPVYECSYKHTGKELLLLYEYINIYWAPNWYNPNQKHNNTYIYTLKQAKKQTHTHKHTDQYQRKIIYMNRNTYKDKQTHTQQQNKKTNSCIEKNTHLHSNTKTHRQTWVQRYTKSDIPIPKVMVTNI